MRVADERVSASVHQRINVEAFTRGVSELLTIIGAVVSTKAMSQPEQTFQANRDSGIQRADFAQG